MRNLRNWLDYLDTKQRLAVIQPGVKLKFELMAILESLEGQKACFFPAPEGHSVAVAGGILAQRQWAAEALNVNTTEVLPYFSRAVGNPTPWKIIPQDKAPIHEVIHQTNIDVKTILPIVTTNELDAGPYITCGLVHGVNLETKKQNLSINRLQVHAPDKLGILMLPRDLYAYYKIAEQRNEPQPITITIGHDPLIELASQAIAPRDLCELEIAGTLQGTALEVTKSYTNDVYIPAHAEIAIEGHIMPHMRSLEGPFGEFPKYYSGAGLQPYIQITAITHRKNPIYKTNNPSGLENIVLGGIPREASLLNRIQLNFPNVIDLRLTAGGLGRYHIVIKVKKSQYGEAKNIIACAFGCHYDIKQVIVVDDDINIDDPLQIEWAVATRFQAERDLVILNHALGSKLDPSTDIVKRGLGSKIGLDATIYMDESKEFYVTKVPGMDKLDLQSWIQNSNAAFKDYL